MRTTEPEAKLAPNARALFEKPNLAFLATVNPKGKPQVTPVWVDVEGDVIVVNTARGRVKERNIGHTPYVAISVADKDNPYATVSVVGPAEMDEAGADEHIDRLAKKYLGVESYPLRREGEQRVKVYIYPKRIAAMGVD